MPSPHRVLLTVALLMLLIPAGAALAQTTEVDRELDWLSIAIQFVAGLSLFLYGVTLLSSNLKEAAGDRMRTVLRRAASSRVAGVGAGTLTTFILDSSSVTIIILIAIVDAGLLAFAHVIPVIMGSNIGTTLSSQIFALDIDEYAPLALAIGLGLAFIPTNPRWRQAGLIIFAIGLIFFGLHVIGDSVAPLEERPELIDWMKRMETPLLGALAGCVLTVAIQSSSATMGIIITLASQGLVSLPAGVAMMLGAEIGTCADTLIATVGRSREAIRAGLFHLLFNIITVIVGLLLIEQLTDWAMGSAADTEQQIANAHVAFNIAGTLLFLPFTRWIAGTLSRLVPDGRPVRQESPQPAAE